MKRFSLMCFFLLLPVIAWAEKVVFVSEDYPPYEYMENGKVVGFDADIIREVCSRIGVEADFKQWPWKRAMVKVKDGSVDAIFSLFRTPEREEFLIFPAEPLSSEKNVVIVRKGSPLKLTRLDDLKGKTVGVVVEYSYGAEFDNFSGIEKEVCKSTENMLQKLDAKRMDIAVINEHVMRYLSRKLGLQDRFDIQFVLNEDPMYVGFSKAKGGRSQELADKFSATLKQLKTEGRLAAIMAAYK
ncbi:MAG: substrate-binding periplasmic protein [Thermodesulfobacteriota bacterium]